MTTISPLYREGHKLRGFLLALELTILHTETHNYPLNFPLFSLPLYSSQWHLYLFLCLASTTRHCRRKEGWGNQTTKPYIALYKVRQPNYSWTPIHSSYTTHIQCLSNLRHIQQFTCLQSSYCIKLSCHVFLVFEFILHGPKSQYSSFVMRAKLILLQCPQSLSFCAKSYPKTRMKDCNHTVL